MAETFVFNIANEVLEKLGSLTLQQVYLAWDVKSRQEKLENTLSTIRAVLLDAEEQQAKNHQLTNWLGKLKDALYDADDVLDEFQYEGLRRQVVNHGGIKKKVHNFFSQSNPLAFRFKMSHKIKKIIVRLDDIAAEKSKFHLRERVLNRRVVHGEREMTHSFVRTSDVIGRDDDRENIVQLLMFHSNEENVSIIPIVGVGGLGKTTLAKLVYNDERVNQHFDPKIWICVSEVFDVRKVAKEIFNSIVGTSSDDLTIDQLQTSLRSTLDNKKFLLILDDVWNDNRGKWIELRDLLLGGANGSKIIVTTRSKLVATITGTMPTYNLKGLSDEDCLSLIAKWAFRKGEEKQYPNLLKIGYKIVKRCGGIPLAVRTLGSLLYLKTNERDWMFIEDNEIWKFEQKEDDILPVLRLSYDEMPSYLKQCFVYCSIFPKDHNFLDYELTQFWMAQGLLQSSNENQELEDIGQRYVKELWSRSFFQDVEDHGTLLRFKMHDLVHDLALSLAQSECFIVNFRANNISKRVRHVSFLEDPHMCWEEVPRFLVEQNKVRTIFFPVEGVGPTSKSFVETCISKFKYMRVLHLSDSCFEVLPSSIGDLKHLRYLDLSRNRSIKKLPKSIYKLQNLQTLVLEGCSELEELPRNIRNLISLRSSDITTKQMFLPEEGIESLISLRYLGFEGCRNLRSLGEWMKRLTALQTLFIQECQSLVTLSHSIKHLAALETLGIWGCEKVDLMDSEEDIEGLRLSLRSLLIDELPQLVALPQWLQASANTLQCMYIIDCNNLASLPEWLQNFTSLQRLEIKGCPKLSALPEGLHHLTTLTELTISWCPKLRSRCQCESGEDWPKIAHVPEFTLDGKKIKSIDIRPQF